MSSKGEKFMERKSEVLINLFLIKNRVLFFRVSGLVREEQFSK